MRMRRGSIAFTVVSTADNRSHRRFIVASTLLRCPFMLVIQAMNPMKTTPQAESMVVQTSFDAVPLRRSVTYSPEGKRTCFIHTETSSHPRHRTASNTTTSHPWGPAILGG